MSAPPAATPSPLPTFPTAPPLSGRIAYNTDDHAIWIMNADGSNQHRVSSPGSDGNDFDPRWSPDGRFITFRSSRGAYGPDTHGTGTEGIWILDVESGRERQLFPPDAQTTGGLFAAPGPNGLIALSTVDTIAGEPKEVITVVDQTGKRLKTFDVDGGECSLWSPDGSRIAYCHHGGGLFSSDGRFAVWLMNADGSNRHKLSESPGSADPDAWSPDGRRLVYDSGIEGSRHVYVTGVDGRDQKQLTSMPGTQAAVACLADARIIFSWWPPDASRPRWLVMNGDGSNIAEITEFERANVTALTWHE
jgi:Tol biopolymer transport system component